jgi:hypothetical protein
VTDSDRPFVGGNERLARMLTDPRTARAVAVIRTDMRQTDEVWRQGLAAVREAIGLALDDLVDQLRTPQVSTPAQSSNYPNMLLECIGSHLAAIGGTDARIEVQLNGQNIELALPSPDSPRDAHDPSNVP